MNARVTFPAPDDEVLSTLSGSLSHTITLTTSAPFDIADTLAVSFAQIKQSRLGGAYQYRIRLTGLSPSEARRLTDGLATQPGVTGATVEHLISR